MSHFDPNPYKIVKINENMVSASRVGHSITRNISFFKKWEGLSKDDLNLKSLSHSSAPLLERRPKPEVQEVIITFKKDTVELESESDHIPTVPSDILEPVIDSHIVESDTIILHSRGQVFNKMVNEVVPGSTNIEPPENQINSGIN